MKIAIIILSIIQALVIAFLLLTFFGVITTESPVLVVQDHTEELNHLDNKINEIIEQKDELTSSFTDEIDTLKTDFRTVKNKLDLVITRFIILIDEVQ